MNKHVTYHHFKMESLTSAVNLMTQNCYMASIDLNDAYYSVPIHEDFQKYLCFQWQGNIYAYTCLPNGIASAPRLFTKICKLINATLRNEGHVLITPT